MVESQLGATRLVGYNHLRYPTSASEIICLLETPTKYWEFFPILFVETTDFQLVFNFEQTRTHFGHTMMAKPIKALELHYSMIQFLIIIIIIIIITLAINTYLKNRWRASIWKIINKKIIITIIFLGIKDAHKELCHEFVVLP